MSNNQFLDDLEKAVDQIVADMGLSDLLYVGVYRSAQHPDKEPATVIPTRIDDAVQALFCKSTAFVARLAAHPQAKVSKEVYRAWLTAELESLK